MSFDSAEKVANTLVKLGEALVGIGMLGLLASAALLEGNMTPMGTCIAVGCAFAALSFAGLALAGWASDRLDSLEDERRIEAARAWMREERMREYRL